MCLKAHFFKRRDIILTEVKYKISLYWHSLFVIFLCVYLAELLRRILRTAHSLIWSGALVILFPLLFRLLCTGTYSQFQLYVIITFAIAKFLRINLLISSMLELQLPPKKASFTPALFLKIPCDLKPQLSAMIDGVY